jgi:hypothetical protein
MTAKLAILEERVLETAAGAQASVDKIMVDVGGIVKDVRGTVEDVGGIVKDVRGTVETTLVAVNQGVAGTQASVEKIVKDVGGIVEDVKVTVDTTFVAMRQGVAGAQASVEEIVEHMKGTIGDTVATVQRTFDLPSQVEHHPWPMFGGALLVGYMLGSWGGGRTSAAGSTRATPSLAAGPTAARAADASSSGSPPVSCASSARPQPQQGIVSGILEQLKDEMKDEMASLKSVAVGAVMSTLRGMFKQAISTLATCPENVNTKRGGQASDSPESHPASVSRAAVNGVPS